MMARLMVVTLVLVLGAGGLGCSWSNDEVRALRVQVDSLSTMVRNLEETASRVPTRIVYQLSDLGRASKTVGYIGSDVPLTKGDRIFLGDDMWDVAWVKVYTLDKGKQGDVPIYGISEVELLVTFAGKGKDPQSARR